MAVRLQDIGNDVYEDSGREEILDTDTALKHRAMHNPAIHRRVWCRPRCEGFNPMHSPAIYRRDQVSPS